MTNTEVPTSTSPEDKKAQKEQLMKEILDPAGAALLIIDMQNDFVSPEGKCAADWGEDISPMQAIMPRIEQLADLFRANGRPVIFTKTYEDPELRTTAGYDRFILFENGDRDRDVACLKGSPGAELTMQPQEGDEIIEKTRLSAVKGTRLKELLKEKGVKTVFLTGVKTQRCVQNTLHDLYEGDEDKAGPHAVVLEDCVATDDVKQHEVALAEMKQFYPPVISSEKLKEAWTNTT